MTTLGGHFLTSMGSPVDDARIPIGDAARLTPIGIMDQDIDIAPEGIGCSPNGFRHGDQIMHFAHCTKGVIEVPLKGVCRLLIGFILDSIDDLQAENVS